MIKGLCDYISTLQAARKAVWIIMALYTFVVTSIGTENPPCQMPDFWSPSDITFDSPGFCIKRESQPHSHHDCSHFQIYVDVILNAFAYIHFIILINCQEFINDVACSVMLSFDLGCYLPNT